MTRPGRATLALLVVAGGLTGAAIGVRPMVVSLQRGDDACRAEFRSLMQNNDDSVRLRVARNCAATTDSVRRLFSTRSAREDRLRLTEMHSTIPEYHDEQRLPSGTGSNLGPMAGIYASPHLGSFVEDQQFAEHGAEGVMVAHVFVGQIGTEVLPQTYQDLGLSFGLNCLWVIRSASAPNWTAKVR